MEYHSNNNTHTDGSAPSMRLPAVTTGSLRPHSNSSRKREISHRATEAGHSESLTAFLDAMAHFHSYSFGNVLLIARQKPDATRVAGMFTWNQLGAA